MNTSVRLYSLGYADIKTYLFAFLFVLGNLILPQLCHLLPIGGPMLLPIYFFTLIAAYKYGIHVGILTAVLSPVINSLVFSMPPLAVLPVILVKSVLLAVAAAYAAKYFKGISILALVCAVLVYQIIGTAIEWLIVKDFFAAVQDFRIGVPGMLIQVIGGYFVLKALAKY
ncbi:ECF transporter S component [Parabacteroides pacaensis]|uniref:ECF transporter S component n=1 Tax=Parabacteroides pacaensis TaxID=2086575 RepID=UPI000D10615F|nr:ECF transporter S component [Parabacteroides pacaensis]